jgi:hypothetical protein
LFLLGLFLNTRRPQFGARNHWAAARCSKTTRIEEVAE